MQNLYDTKAWRAYTYNTQVCTACTLLKYCTAYTLLKHSQLTELPSMYTAYTIFKHSQLTQFSPVHCTIKRFVWVNAKFGTCTVVSVNGTLIKDKMRWFKGECAHFSCNKRPIYTLEGASTKFSTNSHETDNSVHQIKVQATKIICCQKATVTFQQY